MRTGGVILLALLLSRCDGFEHDVYWGPRLFEGKWDVVAAFDDRQGQVTDQLLGQYEAISLDFGRIADRTGDLVVSTKVAGDHDAEDRVGRWFDEWDLLLEDWALRWVFEVCQVEQSGDDCEFWDWTVEYLFLEDGEVLVWTYGRYLNELLQTDAFTSWDWGTLQLRGY
jgi:hypothetical protein